MISLIGGKFKKKNIFVPHKDVRPTSSIKREAIFSILESLSLKNSFELYYKKCFIDLFAGSGSLGLEAISRGASFSYFYESNNNVNKILKKNCDMICKKNEYKIYNQDSTTIKYFDIDYPVSVIFIDPPYKFLLYDKILELIIKSKIINKDTIIVIELDKKNTIESFTNFNIINEKIYGKTKLLFLKN